MFYNRRSGLRYIDRGLVEGGYDFTDFPTDLAIHTLDLSSIVPANAKIVDVMVDLEDSAAWVAIYLSKVGHLTQYRRKCGYVDGRSYMQTVDATIELVNQSIDYKCINTPLANISLTILGWWI